jgi:hypothetical protein
MLRAIRSAKKGQLGRHGGTPARGPAPWWEQPAWVCAPGPCLPARSYHYRAAASERRAHRQRRGAKPHTCGGSV